jgi:beta-1,4-mannosyltransferase
MPRIGGEIPKHVRVLSIPGPRHAQNSYFPLLWRALEGAGLDMVDARSNAAFMLKFDILHVHFPEHLVTERSLQSALVSGPLFLAYVVAVRIAGKNLIWTIHEIAPKRRLWLARPFLWCMRRLTNAYVFMNRTSEDEFFSRYPKERQKVICRVPHSAYPVTKISAADYDRTRMSLTQGTQCLLVGFLGEIRPYKNPIALQYLPPSDFQGRPLLLIVAGTIHASSDAESTEAAISKLDADRLVQIRERLSDEQLSKLIQSIDLVFMPYLQGWNSGFAMFALACGARLLCSNLPMFREMAEALGPPWIYLFDHNAADLSHELNAAVGRITQDRLERADYVHLERFLAAHSFEKAASEYTSLFHILLSKNLRDGPPQHDPHFPYCH